VVNVSDIKHKNIPGNKAINSILNNGNLCYLSCGFGIVVIDLIKLEIKDTYIIGKTGLAVNVHSCAIGGNTICAATDDGLAVAIASNPNLANYSFWTYWSASNNSILDTLPQQVLSFNNKLVAIFKNKIGTMNMSTAKWSAFYSEPNWAIRNLSANTKHLIINEYLPNDSSRLLFLTSNFQLEETVFDRNYLNGIRGVEENLTTNERWYANAISGLVYSHLSSTEFIVPNAPLNNNVFDMEEKNGSIWAAAGSVDNNYSVYLYNPDGFYSFGDETWNTYDRYANAALQNVLDMICVAIDNDAHVYLGSYGSGLVELKNGVVTQHKQDVGLQAIPGDNNSFRVTDVKLDNKGNLWMTNFGVPQPLVLLQANGNYVRFNNPYSIIQLGKIMIDKNGQLWIINASANGGVLVYNPGSDLTSADDDTYRFLQKGGGVGNLPDSRVLSIAEDKDGSVWVGTAAGVGIFYDAANIITQGEAQQIVVSKDSINAYLLGTEVINDIQIDGAGRKWFATTHGAYLIATDGLSEVFHFNTDNSPLLDNNILTISIQSKSGEVFFGTEKGICSYKSTATSGGEKNDNVLAYPNPVPHNYTGTIAIKGLVDNARVKITDISGKLIYSTTALGGQAVWNGYDLKGEKTASGVYLVFATNREGSETVVTKLLYEK
jgi:ligand-binding sensor domain-containing protein